MAAQEVAIPDPGSTTRPRKRKWRRVALLAPSVLILTLLLVGAIFADLLSRDDPREIVLANKLLPPAFDGGAWDHPLGAHHLDRDMLARLMHGARVSLIVVAIAIPASATIGTLVGLTAG